MADAGVSRQNIPMNPAAEALHKFNQSFFIILLLVPAIKI